MSLDTTDQGGITAVLGPTNTGKTHYAIERMLARESGIIGLPLRLLAREIYDRIVGLRGPRAVSLITGEERIAPASARYHVCTVEAMPDLPVDFVAIDEIQLAADPDRGHVFTDRLLHRRGHYETLFLGSDTMRGLIGALVPKARFMRRERFSTLTYTGVRKLSRLRPRTAVVAFSVDQVYAIAELVRRQRGGAAVVMGALSPRTRNAQVALYQEGEVDYMIATDAIGMGLNMDVDHVAFAGVSKFDGWRHRTLLPHELGQIAGRAGRYTRDGTFGVTGEVAALDPGMADAIEKHRFKPLTRIAWRNTDLEFGSVPRLIASLEAPPGLPELHRAREADDMAALRTLSADPAIADRASPGAGLRLLWEVCQIPDFRKTSPQDHATILARIYRFLRDGEGAIPSDWLAGQVQRLDRVEGDIDTLSKRLAFVRTWTYVAHRAGWVDDGAEWRERTRAVEDRLSDALHARLTQRFVDRRTSTLMRRLKQKERLVAEVNDKGEVRAEGHYLGRLDGFRFTVDESASADELKTLRSASLSALQAEFAKRADKLYLSPDTEIDVTDQGGLMWGTDAIGRLAPGDDPLVPKVVVFVDEMAEPAVAEKVERRLVHWIGRRVNTLFEPMLAMRDDEAIAGLARGIAFRLSEHFGVIPRREVAGDIKQLAQDERALLRKHGVRFGQHNIFMPALLKPAPTRLRLLLWSLSRGLDDFAEAPPPGLVTIPVNESAPEGYWEMAGYRAAGARALRIDMLERLADMIRQADARAGFEATQDMLSITGCTLEQFADMMQGLGYRAERAERVRPVRPAPASAAPIPDGSGDPVAGVSDDAAGVPDASGGDAPEGDGTAPETAGAGSQDAPTASALLEADAPSDQPADAGVVDDAAPMSDTQVPDAATHVTGPVSDNTAEPEGQAPVSESDASEQEETAVPVPDTAAPGDAEAVAATAEADPEAEREVFYTFTLAPRSRPGQGRRRDQAGQDKPRRAKGKGKPGEPRGGQKREGKPGGKPRPAGNKEPRREKPIDPDNPFAVLQQLKNR